MKEVYLGLGTNLGNRGENLKKAAAMLEDRGVKIFSKSSFYKTEPAGYKNQPYFFNECVRTATMLSPRELLKTAGEIETEMGREKTIRYGPRIIDIDILFYNNIIIKDIKLTIPHPEITNRRFVLVPMEEIAGNFIHPELNLSISDLLAKCRDTGKVIKTGAAGG